MREYRFALIRFVPDADRMEPTNVGIILQGSGRIDVRLSPHAAKRKQIDTDIFRQWRQFFLDEIRGEATPLFQPPKGSPEFLIYLERLCEGSILLSRPLIHASDNGFDQVLESLYLRLVAPPEATSPAAASRPTGLFRQITETRNFLRRGMSRHAHVVIDNQPLWMAYRQVANGELIAMDKIEVNVQVGATANEIERMPLILEKLPIFLRGGNGHRRNRYYFLADQVQEPFTDQSQADFIAMRSELEVAVEKVEKAGGIVVRTVPETENLANVIDSVLPTLQPSSAAD